MLYVDDPINSTSDATEALQLSEEMIHILSEARMNLRRFHCVTRGLKRANIDCRETSQVSGKYLLLSDSQICIHWIKGKADDWKPFVRNRVSEIKEKTDPNRWHHCVGKSNPADKLTRGMNAKALVKDEIWIKGPS
ncbi:uncharacterized protein TNCV_1042231 [Trichonephila clavipes]|nr:uncharacterized protein TNCV_1042231 [Trichonephila clavipes]